MSDHTFEDLGELLDAEGAARFLSVKPRLLETWRLDNPPRGPSYIRVGGHIRYPYKWLRQWLLDNAQCPDGECPKGGV
jgi:hypothetical protein